MDPREVDPTGPAPFTIDENTVVASAGSCFAQHIKNALVKNGFNYLVTEPGDPDLSADEREDLNFGVFPARFGNVYTTPQLLQLFRRSFGRFQPEEDHWVLKDRYYDPFRPEVQPGGWRSLDKLRQDRMQHLDAVRRMFEQAEVLIFTLGLTEGWRSRIDGAVFPLVPGYRAGVFDPERHEFVNFGVDETCRALFSFIEELRDVNPGVRLVLTVSPVPLGATMNDRHVIEATSYSKAVLRIVAEEARRTYPDVAYFPSYEIITATGRTQDFFAGDRRTVTATGVSRVMDLFLHRFAGRELPPPLGNSPAPEDASSDVICDEETMLRILQRTEL